MSLMTALTFSLSCVQPLGTVWDPEWAANGKDSQLAWCSVHEAARRVSQRADAADTTASLASAIVPSRSAPEPNRTRRAKANFYTDAPLAGSGVANLRSGSSFGRGRRWLPSAQRHGCRSGRVRASGAPHREGRRSKAAAASTIAPPRPLLPIDPRTVP